MVCSGKIFAPKNKPFLERLVKIGKEKFRTFFGNIFGDKKKQIRTRTNFEILKSGGSLEAEI